MRNALQKTSAYWILCVGKVWIDGESKRHNANKGKMK